MHKVTNSFDQYREGGWVHYSKLPQLTINPQQFHQDPAGYYLFPESFQTEGAWHRYPYRLHVKLNPNAHVLDIGTLTYPDIKNLIEKIGFQDLLNDEYLNPNRTDHENRDRFWDIVRMRFMGEPGKFNKTFRRLGYDAIFDDDQVIHNAETQLLVLNPRVVTVEQVEEQKASAFEEIEKVMDVLAKKFGQVGEVKVEKPRPKKDWGANILTGYVEIRDGDRYVSFTIKPWFVHPDEKVPESIQVSIRDSKQTGDRSYGETLKFRNFDDELYKLTDSKRDVVQRIQEVFGKAATSSIVPIVQPDMILPDWGFPYSTLEQTGPMIRYDAQPMYGDPETYLQAPSVELSCFLRDFTPILAANAGKPLVETDEDGIHVTIEGKGEASGQILTDYEWWFVDSEQLTPEEAETELPYYQIALLEHVEVQPEYRREGVGGELVRAFIKAAKKYKADAVFLNASPMGHENRSTIGQLVSFYKSLGFKTFKNYGDNQTMYMELKSQKKAAAIETESRLVQRHNKHTDREEWALISKNGDRVLRWFGTRKPSEERVQQEERRVQYFKHHGSVTAKTINLDPEKTFRAWYKMYDQDEGLKIALNMDPYGDEQAPKEEARRWFNMRLKRVKRQLDKASYQDGVIAYRCMLVTDTWKEAVRQGKLRAAGGHWTIDRELAPYLCGGHGGKLNKDRNAILEAYIPFSEFDVLDAFNPGWSEQWEEFEITPTDHVFMKTIWNGDFSEKIYEYPEPTKVSVFAPSFTANVITAGQNGNWKEAGFKLTHTADNKSNSGPVDPKNQNFMVLMVDSQGNEIGSVQVWRSGKNKIYSNGTYVEPEHRRKGIASAMYRYAEKISGKKFVPSESVTKDPESMSGDARRLWKDSERSFGSANRALAKATIPEDSELMEFYNMADAEAWRDEIREEHESDWNRMSEAERKAEIPNVISHTGWRNLPLDPKTPEEWDEIKSGWLMMQESWAMDNNNNTSETFFENAKIVMKPTLVRFTDFPDGVFDNGHEPSGLGLTVHEGTDGDGDLAFAFNIKELKTRNDWKSAQSKYGKHIFKFKVPYAVEADHISDYERQTVFDINTVTDVKEVSLPEASPKERIDEWVEKISRMQVEEYNEEVRKADANKRTPKRVLKALDDRYKQLKKFERDMKKFRKKSASSAGLVEAAMPNIPLKKLLDMIPWQESFYDLYPGFSKEAKDPEDMGYQEYKFDDKDSAMQEAREMIEMFQMMPDPIPIYRVIHAKSEGRIKTDCPGSSWSWEKQSAISFALNHGLPKPLVLMSAEVRKKDVDWASTVRLYYVYSGGGIGESENEIRVPNDCRDIKNLKWEWLDKKKNKRATAKSEPIDMFIGSAGQYYYAYENLMDEKSDSLWEEQQQFNEEEGVEETREEWARAQEEFHQTSGDPSMTFDAAERVPSDQWLIHFTDADPYAILENGFHGRDVNTIGFTTYYKAGTNEGNLALAYRPEDIPVRYGRHLGFGKYGKNAVIFKAKDAARAYHHGDEEHQTVFDVRGVKSMYPVFGDSDSLTLYNPKKQQPIARVDRSPEGLEQIIERLNKKNLKPDESVAESMTIAAPKKKKKSNIDFTSYGEGEEIPEEFVKLIPKTDALHDYINSDDKPIMLKLTVTLDGKPAGVGTLEDPSIHGLGLGDTTIIQVFVSPKARGAGIGTKLMDLLQEAKDTTHWAGYTHHSPGFKHLAEQYGVRDMDDVSMYDEDDPKWQDDGSYDDSYEDDEEVA